MTIQQPSLATTDFAMDLEDVDVVFRRRGSEPFRALQGLTVAIPSGSILCLLGPNGSGKTTAINVITGLLRPSSGSVRVMGLDPTKHRRQVLRRIALVPQETALYAELTGRENLEFHAHYHGVAHRDARQRINNLLDLVGLVDRADHRAGTYSGGMQRRLALARALLTDPEFVLLDEPTLGVDVQSRQAIWERIEQIADEGRTVLLTTNYMEEADHLGRRVLIIDRGKPVVHGTPAELKEMVLVDRVELTLATGDSASAARELLREFSPTATPRGLALPIPSGSNKIDFVREILHRLPAAGEVTGLRFNEPSLQDVFLLFTGRALRD
ncbi:ATP-binding cassette domain-containing protein [Micromonospora sp. NPDC047707]|uniref:ABC transporter ATP-binding protein n=1 Tax=Micromonospora sp. NPDC047707 TaxID=3154498 RepID=UPI00345544D8